MNRWVYTKLALFVTISCFVTLLRFEASPSRQWSARLIGLLLLCVVWAYGRVCEQVGAATNYRRDQSGEPQ